MEDGQPVLAVKGKHRQHQRSQDPGAPDARGAFDSEAREVYHWTFEPGVGTLGPGASGNFVTRLAAPPAEAKEFHVRFAEPGEQMSAPT